MPMNVRNPENAAPIQVCCQVSITACCIIVVFLFVLVCFALFIA